MTAPVGNLSYLDGVWFIFLGESVFRSRPDARRPPFAGLRKPTQDRPTLNHDAPDCKPPSADNQTANESTKQTSPKNISHTHPKWLFWRLNASDIQARFKGDAREVARKTLNISLLRKTPFKLPSLKKQREIVRRIEAAFAEIERISVVVGSALNLCNRLDQRILIDAFAGELVLQDTKDEPASALLSRIRKARYSAPKKLRLRQMEADAMKKNPKEILLERFSLSWNHGAHPVSC